MHANTGSRRARAFSLVELLIVIAIMSTLAALLLPTLQHAMESSRITQCINTFRQHGLACSYYIGDNKEHFPYVGTGFSRFYGGVTYNRIGTYYSPGISMPAFLDCDRGPLRCPSVGVIPNRNSSYYIGYSQGHSYFISGRSYVHTWFNYYACVTKDEVAANMGGRPVSYARRPSAFPVMYEAVTTVPAYFRVNPPTAYDNYRYGGTVSWGHHGGFDPTPGSSTQLFLDGHVAHTDYARHVALCQEGRITWTPR